MGFLNISLELLPHVRQFILYRLEKRKSGTNKIPISPISGHRVAVTDSEHWVTAFEALTVVQSFHCDGIGFVIDLGFWLLDIDHCLVNGSWTPLAQEFCAKFAGAYIEESCSGEGLHIIGRGQAPEHVCRAKGLEFYTEKRFVALTGSNARGSMDFNAEHLLSDLVNTYFTKSTQPAKADNATCIGCLVDDDEKLIQLMLKSKKNPFGGGASFRDLWEGNEVVLTTAYPTGGERQDGLFYDASSADAALATHLSFWIGNDKERIKRLMYQSALIRDKWHQRDDYIDRTIDFACTHQTNYYQGSISAEPKNGEDKFDSDLFGEVSIADIFTNPPCPPSFVIESILPRGVLTLLGGHGGSGKSLLALYAAACIATGRPFMGKQVKQGRVLFYSAEDSSEIIRHRLYRLCRHMEIDPVELSTNLKILDATNEPVLYEEINNTGVKKGKVTSAYEQLKAEIEQFVPHAIIIDNASDTFDANENERRYVRGFIRSLVQLGKSYNAAILLIAHVDKQAAKGSGSSEGYSGSTAWHNSARSRLFLTIKDNLLVLEHQKSNWGKCAEPIYLKWTADGLLEFIETIKEQDSRPTILNLIHKYSQRRDYISTKDNSRSNAFKMLRLDPAFPIAMTREKLTMLLRQLEDEGQLERETYTTDDRKSRQRYKVKVAPSAPSSNFELSAESANSAPCSAPSTTGGAGECAQGNATVT